MRYDSAVNLHVVNHPSNQRRIVLEDFVSRSVVKIQSVCEYVQWDAHVVNIARKNYFLRSEINLLMSASRFLMNAVKTFSASVRSFSCEKKSIIIPELNDVQ